MKVIFPILVLFISLFSLTLPSYAAEKTVSKVNPKIEQLASATVNINTASAQQLADELVGIGLLRASEIVAYRKAKGPFKHANDLVVIKGIGEAIVKRNQSKIRLK